MKIAVFSLLLASLAHADMLPQLDDKPWTGWFAGYETRKFRFGVNREGEAYLMPMKNRDETIYNKNWIRLTPVIEVVREGRGPITKKIEMNGWAAQTEASDEAEKISYRGTVTGGAVFEVTIEIDGATIRMGGRLVEEGTLAGEKLRFGVRAKMPNLHYREKDEDKLEDKTGDDRYDFIRVGGEKEKLDGWDMVDGDEFTQDGFSAVRIDMESYEGRLDMIAGPGGHFEIWTGGEKRAYQSMSVNWIHQPEKDPNGEARFELTFK